MDRMHRIFLNILRCSLEGTPVTEPLDLTPEEWDALFRLAQAHHVLPMIFEAVRTQPRLLDTGLLAALKRQVIHQVMIQTRKTADFLALMEKFHAAGIRPLVVKGIICRSLYPLPDHRSSSDEDVLILPSQSALCHEVLTGFGLETALQGERLETDYEIPYRQANGPLYIELHRHLFPPESESYGDLNRFFRNARERYVTETISGVPVDTLEYTDHLFYLICHAFKHFLHSGFGIRQVCDIVMYANHYGGRIHWTNLLASCREIRADRFAAAIFRIGENWLVFDPAKACYPEQWQAISVDETAMLEDLLLSGVYGGATMSRLHSSSITLDAVASQKQGKKKGNSLMLSLFPPAKKLEAGYPYLKDRPYLLPAAWVSRAVKYAAESRRDPGSSAAESLKIGNRRLELLRQYGIIE